MEEAGKLLVGRRCAPTVVGSHGLRAGEAAWGSGNGPGGCWLLVGHTLLANQALFAKKTWYFTILGVPLHTRKTI